MKSLLKQKDEALMAFDSRKFTIDIMIFKIKQLNENFMKEKTKLQTAHKDDIIKLKKEIDQLKNNLRTVLIEESKSLPGKAKTPIVLSIKEKMERDYGMTSEDQSKRGLVLAPSKQHITQEDGHNFHSDRELVKQASSTHSLAKPPSVGFRLASAQSVKNNMNTNHLALLNMNKSPDSTSKGKKKSTKTKDNHSLQSRRADTTKLLFASQRKSGGQIQPLQRNVKTPLLQEFERRSAPKLNLSRLSSANRMSKQQQAAEIKADDKPRELTNSRTLLF